MSKNNEILKKKLAELKNIVTAYHDVICIGNPDARLPDVDTLTKETQKMCIYSKFYLNIHLLLSVTYLDLI